MSDLMFAYGIRIFLAVYMAVILAAAFHATWKEETGKKKRSAVRTDTVIWLDPIVFAIGPVVFVFFIFLLYGGKRGAVYSLSTLIDIFLFISIYFTILLVFLPVLRKYYTARACATLWLIPVFLFYMPHIYSRIAAELPYVVIYIPEKKIQILFGIWLAGFLILLTAQVVSHLLFSRKLMKASEEVEDPALTELWECEKKKLGQNFPVGLRVCRLISTPLTIGMWKEGRITYLPEQQYTREEAELVFCHELHHIQRNDTHTKFFLAFCKAFGWPLPFVWLAVRRAEDDLELSCDEIVLKDADSDRRKTYARLLLTTAGNARGFTTCLSASAETLRYRMKETVHEKKKRTGTGLLFLVMFLSCFTVGKIAFAMEREDISEVLQADLTDISHAVLKNDAKGTEYAEIQDMKALAVYLADQQVEEMVYQYDGTVSGSPAKGVNVRNLNCEITSPDIEMHIFGDYMEIYRDGYLIPTLYHMAEPLDWEYIGTLVER